MTPIATARLTLRELTPEDAPFILKLVNDPDWLRFIGDKGVRTLDDARTYIESGPMAMYRRQGFGLWLVQRAAGLPIGSADGLPIGTCGLIKRDTLDDVDIGFAFLPEHRGLGYAREAAAATLAYGRDIVGLKRVVAITALDNASSIRLLERIGLVLERRIRLAADGPELNLLGCAL